MTTKYNTLEFLTLPVTLAAAASTSSGPQDNASADKSSNLGGADNAEVHNVLNKDETEWLAEEGRTEEQGFVLRTRGCERKITGVRIQNAAKPHASKSFKISSALGLKEPWNKLLQADLEESESKG